MNGMTKNPGSDGAITFDGSCKQAVETGRTRIAIAGLLFMACFAVIGVRLIGVTLFQGGAEPAVAHRAAADGAAAAGRAEITDRNGALLATSLRTASLFANPRKVPDAREAARRLVRVLPDLDAAEVARRLSTTRSFVWLKRSLTPKQQVAVNRLGIPGLDFQYEERRLYPHGALAAHVLGYTDVDNVGIAGIEKAFDGRLTRPRAGLGSGRSALALSLDVRVQHALRATLAEAMAQFRAVGAAGLVMDAQTGEVLALVSLPDFDPNLPGESTPAARFNRATLGVYEMGSTFKTFTAAMALDAGTVGMTGGYDATRPLRAARFVIRDFHGKHRWLSVPEIYMYSSNIGAAKMAEAVGAERQRAFLARLGLLDRPAIELPEVGAPLLPRQWQEVETMTIAYGHGLSVSPLQLAGGVAAMVNGGLAVAPTLLKRPEGDPVPARRVIARRTSDQMRRLMRLVVTRGTGRAAAAKGYLVGGKTGTAEKPSAGSYDRDALITSFVGGFPMTAPRYVVLAMLDEPKGNKATRGRATASLTAAPVIGRVVARIAPLLGVDPVDEEADEIKDALRLEINSRDPKVASF